MFHSHIIYIFKQKSNFFFLTPRQIGNHKIAPWVEETKYGSIQLGQKKTKENRLAGLHLGDDMCAVQAAGFITYLICHKVLGRGNQGCSSRWMRKNFKGKYEIQSRS